jgi:hypothetical protein
VNWEAETSRIRSFSEIDDSAVMMQNEESTLSTLDDSVKAKYQINPI